MRWFIHDVETDVDPDMHNSLQFAWAQLTFSAIHANAASMHS